MKTLISIGLIFTSLAFYSQNKFSSIELGKKYSKSQIKSAINNANWCGYHHEIENFEVLFDFFNWIIFLILSKKFLQD